MPKTLEKPRSAKTGTEKVEKLGIKRVKGYLYFISKEGHVMRVKMARGGNRGGKPEMVQKVGITRKSGYLYYIDKAGDISRARMVNA